nr:MAG TPA: hypothetical protein [Caudoviricetes sp.]
MIACTCWHVNRQIVRRFMLSCIQFVHVDMYKSAVVYSL